MNERRLSLALPAGTVLCRGRDRYILGGVTGFGGTSLFYTAKKEGSTLPFGIKECCPAEMTRYLRREGGVLTGVSAQAEHALGEARKRMMRETEISRNVAAVSAQTIPVWEAPRDSAVETAAGRTPAPAGSFLILRDMSSVGMFLPQLLEECALPPAEGHPLRTGGRPHIHTAACILEQALQALELVHKAGYLYGDMQVQNVFFAGARPEKGKIGLACLLDFGCARPLTDRAGGGQETARIEDRMVFSTPGYTAPEILWHNDGNLRLTPAADVYSAGRLLLFLLRGRTYFENGRDRLLTEQASLGCVLPYEGERLGCSARSLRLLQRILDRSLEPEREKRYQTAAAMLEEVEELAWMTRSPTDRLSLSCPALPDEEFLPREEKLAEINRCLERRRKPVVVWGFAGMGKTELALKFAQKYTRGQAYAVRFRNSVRQTVTGPIADAFSGYDRRDIHGREKPEEQIYREVMKRLGERSENDLLILDNMDGDEGGFDVLRGEPAFRDLCALPMGLVVTTRSPAEGGVEVDAMPLPQLRQLLRRFAPELSDEMADALIRAVEGHTLTVELMGRTLKTSIPRLSPEALLEKLTRGDLDSGALAKVASPKDREGRMERIQGHLTALFRLSNLPPEEKRLLAYALPVSPEGLAAEDFAQVPGFDQDVLLRLMDRGWIRRGEDDVLTMHPLVQEIGLRELDFDPEDIRRFAAQLYLRTESGMALTRRRRNAYIAATIGLDAFVWQSGRICQWALVRGWTEEAAALSEHTLRCVGDCPGRNLQSAAMTNELCANALGRQKKVKYLVSLDRNPPIHPPREGQMQHPPEDAERRAMDWLYRVADADWLNLLTDAVRIYEEERPEDVPRVYGDLAALAAADAYRKLRESDFEEAVLWRRAHGIPTPQT
ncbi:protein kinase domain-containing protein [Dysosmobacter sp.]|uniref:protein kinase domain-containing protein n=1 Tax=Dysosmobacter sp. TaxID=2591382 RepID=UPI002A90652E|nr:hypothetical protein [Dysosmobacter sp.]MDY3281218.1 hypothetical protein [Dysosmobacter sp.]